jgi:hypothetical protein
MFQGRPYTPHQHQFMGHLTKEINIHLNSNCKVLLEKQTGTQPKNSQPFTKSEALLPLSEEYLTRPYLQLDQPVHTLTLYFFRSNFCIIFPSMPKQLQSLQLKFCMHFSFSHPSYLLNLITLKVPRKHTTFKGQEIYDTGILNQKRHHHFSNLQSYYDICFKANSYDRKF